MKEVKTYRSKATITAYEFKDGMEDGFEIRYSDGVKNENGSISTWGVSWNNSDIKVKVPYLLNDAGRKILVGDNYMVIEQDGYPFNAIPIEIFNNDYELIY